LSILFDQHKLFNHFKAMRHYLLLGQGDFFRHLMDLLKYAPFFLERGNEQAALNFAFPAALTANL
jgi:hypothetical protein